MVIVKELPIAQEFAALSRSRPKPTTQEISRVLGIYFDPSNPETQLTSLMGSLIHLSVRGNRELGNELERMVGEVNEERKFDQTYIGHMLTRPSIPGLIGMALGQATNVNTVAREVSLVESELEPEAIAGLAKIIGYDPKEADGTFTSGGSTAIQVALLARRTQMEEQGLVATEKHPFVILGTDYTHYSWAKMARILAGPRSVNEAGRIVKKNVATNAFKMNPVALRESLIREQKAKNPLMAVVALGGETETGLVDDIAGIIEVASEFNVPVIVDGAYGAPYRLSRHGGLFNGMENSYAVVVDPHKCLHTPYSSGALIFRNKGNTFYRFGDRDSYLGNGEHLGHKRIEGSMGAGAFLATLAVLRTLGPEGLTTVLDLSLDRIEHLFEVLCDSELLAPVHNPELNILCFGLKPVIARRLGLTSLDQIAAFIDETRTELDNGIRGNGGEGGYFFSSTKLPVSIGEGFAGGYRDKDGSVKIPVYRAVIMNPYTTNKIIDDAVAGLEKIIKKRLKK